MSVDNSGAEAGCYGEVASATSRDRYPHRVPGRIEQRERLRAGALPAEAVVVVRGGSDTIDKLRRHALRTARAWALDNAPLFGISVFAVVDRPLDDLLRDRFTTFRRVHLTSVGTLRGVGFDLLPTGLAPHFTVRLDGTEDGELQRLLAVLGPVRDNVQYGK